MSNPIEAPKSPLVFAKPFALRYLFNCFIPSTFTSVSPLKSFVRLTLMLASLSPNSLPISNPLVSTLALTLSPL